MRDGGFQMQRISLLFVPQATRWRRGCSVGPRELLVRCTHLEARDPTPFHAGSAHLGYSSSLSSRQCRAARTMCSCVGRFRRSQTSPATACTRAQRRKRMPRRSIPGSSRPRRRAASSTTSIAICNSPRPTTWPSPPTTRRRWRATTRTRNCGTCPR